MPHFTTLHFETIHYEADSVIEFPNGLPGFEDRRDFLLLQFPHLGPLVCLQSLEDPALCFLTLPVLVADPQYRLSVSEEDLDAIGLPATRQPRIGKEVLCLAILTLKEDGPTANLLAPVLVNLSNLKAAQAILADSGYSHEHPLPAAEMAPCS